MEQVARVVLALEAPEVTEEVMHYLDRSGRARVVATAVDARQLAEAVRQLEPDAIVAEPTLALDVVDGGALLALATRESVQTLRAALRAGARGFYVWPGERDGLLDGVSATLATLVRQERTATVVAVHGSRGGVGTTFVATHLVAAIARRGRACVLIDGDPSYGDLSTALGAPDDARSIAELAPVGPETTWAHVAEVAWSHPDGFATVLAPPAEAAEDLPDGLLPWVVEAAATGCDAVVVQTGRALDAPTRACLSLADRVLEVLSLDVLSFRAATRAREAFSPLALEGRVGFVVNRAARNEITPGDVRRVFGVDPVAVLPRDGAVPRAQDHGRLLPARGRMARRFDRLAARVLEPADAATAHAPAVEADHGERAS
jgi:pilus assembly protein CpaE